MDFFVILFGAVLMGVILVLLAFFTKKSKWQVLVYGLIGLGAGAVAGYLSAPFIISFI